MLFDATIDGRTVRVEVRGRDGRYAVTVDGRTLDVDHQETGAHFASLLIEGRSYEAGLEKRPDGYNVVLGHVHGRSDAATPLTAVLEIRHTDAVILLGDMQEHPQFLSDLRDAVVVEAMKMENELRSPRAGRIAQVPVREGQAVETAALLVVVE